MFRSGTGTREEEEDGDDSNNNEIQTNSMRVPLLLDNDNAGEDARVVEVPQEEMTMLLEETTFSAAQIRRFYQYASTSDGGGISKQNLALLCFHVGLTHAGFVQKLFRYLDTNADNDGTMGVLAPLDLLLTIHPLVQGGSRDEVAGLFFDLYEHDLFLFDPPTLNSSSNRTRGLSAADFVSIYSGMIALASINEQQQQQHGDGGDATTRQTWAKSGLSFPKRKLMMHWLATKQQQQRYGDNNNSSSTAVGSMDRDEFITTLKELEARAAATSLDAEENENPPTLTSLRSLYYICWALCLELGISFAYHAMGALSYRIHNHISPTVTVGKTVDLGILTAAYFIGAALAVPLLHWLDHLGSRPSPPLGSGLVALGANGLVCLGSLCQARATPTSTPKGYVMLLLGRFLIGCGGELLPFAIVDVLSRLFPYHEEWMTGIRNTMHSIDGCLAFVILPLVADYRAGEEGGTPLEGTIFALTLCVVLSFISTLASLVLYQALRQREPHIVHEGGHGDDAVVKTTVTYSAEALRDPFPDAARPLRAFARATRPQLPRNGEKFQFPVSFPWALVGSKFQCLNTLVFTAFSHQIFQEHWGEQTRTIYSSLSTGGIFLIPVVLGAPFLLGGLSDSMGRRSWWLVVASLLSVGGFLLLSLGKKIAGGAVVDTVVALVAILFLGLQHAMTGEPTGVAHFSLRLVVGDPSRAAIGYGRLAVLGNLWTAVAGAAGPIAVEYIASSSTARSIGVPTSLSFLHCGYFAVCMLVAAFCWMGNGSGSVLDWPTRYVIETTNEELKEAAYRRWQQEIRHSTALDEEAASRRAGENPEHV